MQDPTRNRLPLETNCINPSPFTFPILYKGYPENPFEQRLISAPGYSLSAGWAVSLLGAHGTSGVLPVPLLLLESRTFCSNQPTSSMAPN